MTLQKQLVPVVVPQGINTKTNDVLLPMQQSAQLDNYRLDKQGEIRKRFGFNPITPLPSDSPTSVYEARGVFDFNGRVFVVAKFVDKTLTDEDLRNNKDSDLYRVFEYNSSNNSYINRGVTGNFTHELTELTSSDTEEVMPSWAIVGSCIVCSFIRYNSSNTALGLVGGFANVYSLDTYTLLASFTLGTQVVRAKVCYRSPTTAFILTHVGGSTNLGSLILDTQQLTLSSPVVDVATNLSSSQPNFDVKFHTLTQKCLVFYNTGTTATLGYLSSTGALESSPTPLNFPVNGSGAVHLQTQDTVQNRGSITLAWASSTGPNFTVSWAYTPWNWVALPPIGTQNHPRLVRQLTSCLAFLYAEMESPLINSQPINSEVLVWQPSLGPWSLWDRIRSVGLASEALYFQNTVALAHESVLQPTTYIYHGLSGRIVAKMAQSKSGGLAGAIGPVGTSAYTLLPSCLPQLNLHALNDPSSRRFYELLSVTKSGTISQGGILFGTRNIAAIRLQKASPQGIKSSSLFLAGSQVDSWDGVTLCEAGFYVSPENVVATTVTGPTTTAGVYGWAVTYSWEDATGKRWESFAAQGSITLTASQQIQLTIPTLRLTYKTSVVINTYRTTVNGTLLQRCDAGNSATATIIYTPTSPRFNNKTVDFIDLWLAIPVSALDAEIETRAILYTSGGELDNDPPPSCSYLSLYRGRIVYTGLEDKRYIGYSKLFTPETAPNFNSTFILGIPDDGESVTASQQLDDKLILFKPTGIYALAGSGPLNTGLQDDFDTPILVATDVGCTSPQSVVLYANGVLFKSGKGIYELSRSMQASYIGAPVEDYNTLTVTGSVLIDNRNEVRFTTTDKTLVYNYFFQQWMTHSQFASLTSTLVGGVHTICLSDGRIVRETKGFLDGGSFITSTLETGWLASSLQGYQRVYRFLFLGQSQSHVYLSVGLAYDYNMYTSESFRVSTSTMYPPGPLGESGYGVGLFGGPYSGVAQFMVMNSVQKCQSIRIKITDSPVEAGEGFVLSAITALVGAKTGTQKLSAQYRASKN